MSELATELKRRVDGCRARALGNYWTAYVLIGGALVCSVAGSISAASDMLHKAATAVLALIPGIVVLVISTFRFEERAKWWWEKHASLDALYRGLRYEKRDEAEVSEALTATVQELNKKWPSLRPPDATRP